MHLAFTRPGICAVSVGMFRMSGRSPPAIRVANLSLYSSFDAMLICSSEPSRWFSACQNWFLSAAGGIAPGMLVRNVIGLPSPGTSVIALTGLAGYLRKPSSTTSVPGRSGLISPYFVYVGSFTAAFAAAVFFLSEAHPASSGVPVTATAAAARPPPRNVLLLTGMRPHFHRRATP